MIKVHQHALINQMLMQKKKLRPAEKVSRKRATSGKNESRALLNHIHIIKLYLKLFYTCKKLRVTSQNILMLI